MGVVVTKEELVSCAYEAFDIVAVNSTSFMGEPSAEEREIICAALVEALAEGVSYPTVTALPPDRLRKAVVRVGQMLVMGLVQKTLAEEASSS